VQLLPTGMTTSLKIGEDVPHKFDMVVSEVMDLWGLGEGIIPTMRHAHQHLLADGGTLVPSRVQIFVQPVELQLWAQHERDAKVNLAALTSHFKSKFSPLRIQQVPHRWLSDEVRVVLDIDLTDVPAQPSQDTPNLDGVQLCIRMGGKPALRATATSMPITSSGLLCGYGVWWSCDLGHGFSISSAPQSAQRSWKQLVRWLDEPRFVSEGEEVQVLSCYNETQVNVEDVFMPEGMVEEYRQKLQQAGGGQQPMTGSSAQLQEQLQRQQQVAAAKAAAPATATAGAKPFGHKTEAAEEEAVLEVD